MKFDLPLQKLLSKIKLVGRNIHKCQMIIFKFLKKSCLDISKFENFAATNDLKKFIFVTCAKSIQKIPPVERGN